MLDFNRCQPQCPPTQPGLLWPFAITANMFMINVTQKFLNCNQHQHYQVPCISWWCHQMETFLCYWPFVLGIHWSLVNSLQKGQWHRALMFSLIYAWKDGHTNSRDTGDFRYHSTHYDINLMLYDLFDDNEWCHLAMKRWYAWLILWLCPDNERWFFNLMLSLISWVHSQNEPWSLESEELWKKRYQCDQRSFC